MAAWIALATPLRLAGQVGSDPLGPLVAAAWRANLGLAAERLAERRSAAEVHEARALFLPSLALESRQSHFSGVPNIGDFVNPAYGALNQLTGTTRFPTNSYVTLPQRHDSHVELRQPLFNEAIRANYAVARGRNDGERLQVLTVARRLAAEVQILFLNEASARRAVEIYEASFALVQENERVAERLVAAGRATPEAVFRARAERSAVEQQLAEGRQQRAAAARAFNQVLRRPLEAPVEVIPDSALGMPLAIDADAAVAHALAHREELKQLDAGVRTGQAAVRAATAAFLPSVALAVDYGYQGADAALDRPYWVTSLVVSWNLFNGGRDAARRSAAGLEVERVQTLRRDIEERVALEVRTAFEAATVARGAIATADARLAAAEHTFELVRRRYEEGIASPIEFVDARTALTAAQLNRVVTAYRYAIHYVELERAAALRPIELPEESP